MTGAHKWRVGLIVGLAGAFLPVLTGIYDGYTLSEFAVEALAVGLVWGGITVAADVIERRIWKEPA